MNDQEILAEGILDGLKSAVDSVKQYGLNIATAAKAHKELKSLDGQKTWSTQNLQQEAIRIRKELIDILTSASPKVKMAVATAVTKLKAASLSGAYTSRNYYRDFLVYSMIKPVADISKAKVGKFSADVIIDKLVGFVIVAVTGIPALDDIKDAADMATKVVKASSDFARKLSSLQPEALGEDLQLDSKTTFKQFLNELLLPIEAPEKTVPTEAKSLILVHGSNKPNLTINDIEIVRTSGQKQGKKGRVYGGFYTTSKQDAGQAEKYAKMMDGGEPTMYNIHIKDGVKIYQTTADVTRLSEVVINELVKEGYGILVGKDPRNYTEWVVVDKNAIQAITKA